MPQYCEMKSKKGFLSVLSVRTLAYSGVFAAFTLLATQLRLPTAIGYVNLGDGLVLISGYLLGPAAFFPASVGSALADVIAGYPLYIPGTFLIKGIMALLTGCIFMRGRSGFSLRIISFLAAESIMVGGYFVYEGLFIGGWGAALGSILPNLGQGAAGILLALLLTPTVEKLKGERRT